MEIIYRADDGAMFKDKKECQDYEEQFDKMRREVHIYDKNFEELSFNNIDWEEKLYFFQCDTEESFDLFTADFSCSIVYEDSEKLDLFFSELNCDKFMTTKEYENSFGDINYHKAKKFQEKLKKGE